MENNFSKQEYVRKVIHLLIFFFGFFLLVFDFSYCLPVYITISISFILLDFLRLKNNKLNLFYHKFFGFVTRDIEKDRMTSASYAFLSIIIVILFFNVRTAACSIVILSVSDVFASYVGVKHGKFKLGDKTLEGSLSFFISTALILLFFKFSSLQIILVSLGCTAIELLSNKIKIDDNLGIPVIASILLTVL
tara:strand:- start:1061 stop:1636 length:576 start_codon:yes stop_codon:yes gene_type:complete